MPSMADLAMIVVVVFTATAALTLTALAVLAPHRDTRARARRLLELLVGRGNRRP